MVGPLKSGVHFQSPTSSVSLTPTQSLDAAFQKDRSESQPGSQSVLARLPISQICGAGTNIITSPQRPKLSLVPSFLLSLLPSVDPTTLALCSRGAELGAPARAYAWSCPWTPAGFCSRHPSPAVATPPRQSAGQSAVPAVTASGRLPPLPPLTLVCTGCLPQGGPQASAFAFSFF